MANGMTASEAIQALNDFNNEYQKQRQIIKAELDGKSLVEQSLYMREMQSLCIDDGITHINEAINFDAKRRALKVHNG